MEIIYFTRNEFVKIAGMKYLIYRVYLWRGCFSRNDGMEFWFIEHFTGINFKMHVPDADYRNLKAYPI